MNSSSRSANPTYFDHASTLCVFAYTEGQRLTRRWKIRNCSGEIGIIDDMEATNATGLPCLAKRSVLRVVCKCIQSLARGKLNEGNYGRVESLTLYRVDVPASRQILSTVLRHDVMNFAGVLGYPGVVRDL